MTAHNKILPDDANLKCPNCGTAINNVNHQFCEYCGTELPLMKEPSSLKPKGISTSHSRRKHCC